MFFISKTCCHGNFQYAHDLKSGASCTTKKKRERERRRRMENKK
jgi:hypothetical protein